MQAQTFVVDEKRRHLELDLSSVTHPWRRNGAPYLLCGEESPQETPIPDSSTVQFLGREPCFEAQPLRDEELRDFLLARAEHGQLVFCFADGLRPDLQSTKEAARIRAQLELPLRASHYDMHKLATPDDAVVVLQQIAPGGPGIVYRHRDCEVWAGPPSPAPRQLMLPGFAPFVRSPREALQALPNITPALAEQLAAIGVESPAELRALGSVEAYKRLSLVFGRAAVPPRRIAALEGAIQNCEARLLSKEQRADLAAEITLEPQ